MSKSPPFELPVEKRSENQYSEGYYRKIEDKIGNAVILVVDFEKADYIVQVINSHEKLVDVCRNALTSLAITMLPRLDNDVASNDDIIKIVIISLEQALTKAEKQ